MQHKYPENVKFSFENNVVCKKTANEVIKPYCYYYLTNEFCNLVSTHDINRYSYNIILLHLIFYLPT